MCSCSCFYNNLLLYPSPFAASTLLLIHHVYDFSSKFLLVSSALATTHLGFDASLQCRLCILCKTIFGFLSPCRLTWIPKTNFLHIGNFLSDASPTLAGSEFESQDVTLLACSPSHVLAWFLGFSLGRRLIP